MIYKRSEEELQAYLAQQLRFLETSIVLYDQGNTEEAKRIALVLRILFHDGNHSKSLFSMLKMKDLLFYDSSPFKEYNKTPWDVINYIGLIGLIISPSENSIKFAPILDRTEAISARMVKFSEWWTMDIIKDSLGNKFSRKKIILDMVNKDGGAHVDSVINDDYAALIHGDSLGISGYIGTNEMKPILFAERATIRQIAHEAMKSLDPSYKKTLILQPPSAFISSVTVYGEPLIISGKDFCPCGSGIQYMQCHGRLTE